MSFRRNSRRSCQRFYFYHHIKKIRAFGHIEIWSLATHENIAEPPANANRQYEAETSKTLVLQMTPVSSSATLCILTLPLGSFAKAVTSARFSLLLYIFSLGARYALAKNKLGDWNCQNRSLSVPSFLNILIFNFFLFACLFIIFCRADLAAMRGREAPIYYRTCIFFILFFSFITTQFETSLSTRGTAISLRLAPGLTRSLSLSRNATRYRITIGCSRIASGQM